MLDAGDAPDGVLEQHRRRRRSARIATRAPAGVRSIEASRDIAASLNVRRDRPRGRTCCARRCAAATPAARAQRERLAERSSLAVSRRARRRSAARGRRARSRPACVRCRALDRIGRLAQSRRVDDVSGMPAISTCRSTVSRVVPGIGVTIAASSPTSRFSRLDLPTLGAPIEHDGRVLRAAARPCARAPARRVEPSPDRCEPLAHVARAQQVDVLFGKIERRFGVHRAGRSARRAARGPRARTRRYRLRAAARTAVAVAASIRSATLSACARSSLPLRKARLRELAGLGEPRAELDAAREQQPHDRRAAVTVQFEDVLAGVRMRLREVEREARVDRLAAARRET